MTKTCTHCHSGEIYGRDRCQACFQYLYRTGRDRPLRRCPEGHWTTRPNHCNVCHDPRPLCKNCGGKIARVRGRCLACAKYLNRHGKERPKYNYNPRSHCRNPSCRYPIRRGAPNARGGYCQACYQYRRMRGYDRPQRLTGGNKWCECGNKATHKIKTEDYCKICFNNYHSIFSSTPPKHQPPTATAAQMDTGEQ